MTRRAVISAVRKAIGSRLTARAGRVRILFDGDCGFCQRSVRILQRLDVFEQCEWVNFRQADVDVDLSRLEHEMAATIDARTYFGFSAYRALSWRIPLFWPLLPFLYLPGVKPIGDRVYRYVAERRHGICQIDNVRQSPAVDSQRVHLRGGDSTSAGRSNARGKGV